MAITADVLITPPPIPAMTPAPPRPVIAPASERDSANNQRRESSKKENGPLSFRATLSAATATNVNRSSTTADTAVWDDAPEERVVRETRLPQSGPVELTAAEASDLFERAIANNARKGRSPAFAAATSSYASSYFAGSAFYSRPGATLELTA